MFEAGDLVEYVYCPEYDISPNLAKSLEKDQGVVVERSSPTYVVVKWKKNRERRMYSKELIHASIKDCIVHRVMDIEHVQER